MERLQRQAALIQRTYRYRRAGNHVKANELISGLTVENYLHDLGLSWNDLRGKRVLDIGAGAARFAKAARTVASKLFAWIQNPNGVTTSHTTLLMCKMYRIYMAMAIIYRLKMQHLT